MTDEEIYLLESQRENPFIQYNKIELELAESDHAVMRLNIRPESKNPSGMVHGGVMSTMADNAAGIAACTDGRNYVTQNCSLYFLANQREGLIRAEAFVRHRGRTTVLVDVDITGECGRLLLRGAYSFFCVR